MRQSSVDIQHYTPGLTLLFSFLEFWSSSIKSTFLSLAWLALQQMLGNLPDARLIATCSLCAL